VERVLGPADAAQASTGGSNPRLAAADTADVPSKLRSCAVVSDRPEVAAAIATALEARSVAVTPVVIEGTTSGFDAATRALAVAEERAGPLEAVILALAGRGPMTVPSTPGHADWQRILDEHDGIVGQVHTDAAWARAVTDLSAQAERPIRLVTLTDAVTAGGRSRAQSSAQLARAARRATDDRVSAFAVSVEAVGSEVQRAVGELAAHLATHPDAATLSGAELVVSRGWIGLRSHPRPSGSLSLGGTEVPDWFDDALRAVLGR
jgi:hypothetical protein